MDGWLDRRADGWMNGWRQMGKWTDVQIDGWLDRCADGWMNGWRQMGK